MSALKLGAPLLGILLSACNPDFSEPGVCEEYGVRETNLPQAERFEERGMPASDVRAICKADGCVKIRDGIAYAYYPKGDGCLRVHEVCHAIHGPFHTVKYTQRVIAEQSRPACP